MPDRWRDFCREGARPDLGEKEKPSGLDFLEELARRGLQERYDGRASRRVVDRLQHELSVIREVEYADYFLIVWDIALEARVRGIPTLARGSAADSLVCYCLRISTVCPIRFDLCFERFLNPERMKFSKLADIDLDFPWDQRDEMMEYVFERYGRDKVAMIGGFNRFHGRAALADVGKVYGLSEMEVREFTKRMPSSRADQIVEALLERPATTAELPITEAPYPEILSIAKHFEDFPRHFMMHPCGIVVSRFPLADLVPLMPSGRGPQMTQYDMDALEDLGFLKIDLLGQAGLSVLRDVLALVAENHSSTPDIETLPWDDPLTWELIATGNARGVHHIESPAMTTLLTQSNCRDMDCLCAIVSVIRPGAADESKKLAFTRRHQGFEPAEYPHPSLEPYLSDTYGLLVYEEHILQVAHHFAGMNLGRSDVLRRELVKMKNPDLLVELGHEFLACAKESGRDDKEARTVWETLVRFHGYMFNKAHSASYAVEAYQGAWLKARWPAEYMASVLANGRGFYSALFYVLEARRMGIPTVGPCVNRSGLRHLVESTADISIIRPPLTVIKGLGKEMLDRWWSERNGSGPFHDLADFRLRVAPQPSEFDLLLATGSLDHFGKHRPAIFWEWQLLARHAPISSDPTQPDLFDLGAISSPTVREPEPEESDLEKIPFIPMTNTERAVTEVDLLGFPVSLDPFDHFGPDVQWDSYCSITDLHQFRGRKVTVCGLLVQTRHNHTLKGEVMMFCTLADPTGFVECSMFPRTYKRFGRFLELGRHRVLAVSGEVQAFDNMRGETLDLRRVSEPRLAPENNLDRPPNS